MSLERADGDREGTVRAHHSELHRLAVQRHPIVLLHRPEGILAPCENHCGGAVRLALPVVVDLRRLEFHLVASLDRG